MVTQNNMEQPENQPPAEKNAAPRRKNGLVWKILALAVTLLALGLVALDYFSAVRIVSIEMAEKLDARGGRITIHYNRPVSGYGGLYGWDREQIGIERSFNNDGTSEIYTLRAPTLYNSEFDLVRTGFGSKGKVFGLFPLREHIHVFTGIERIALKGLIPTVGSSPAPEVLNNQIVLEFMGNARRDGKLAINIPPSELDFIKMDPEVAGYYQWSDDSTLTFNFTRQPPQFETTYSFEIDPAKLIDKENQVWDGDTKAAITTSTNEVYVKEVSPQGDLNWQTPLIIEFSGRMVGALEILKKKSQDIVPIDIQPRPAGHWTWLNARTIKFIPDDKSGWPTKTQVKIEVLAEINQEKDRKWRSVSGMSSFERYVVPREQSINSYSLHGENVELNSKLYVNFSRDMVPADVLNQPWSGIKPFLIEPEVAGSFRWTAGDRLRFEPDNLWSELTDYKVTLNPKFNPDPRFEWIGTKTFSFRTAENLVKVDYMLTTEEGISPSRILSSPENFRVQGENVPEAHLWIHFGQNLRDKLPKDFDTGAAIEITPPVKGAYHWVAPSLVRFEPEGHWPENKKFKIHVTDRLFHHPQQHYPKDKASVEIAFGEDVIRPLVSADRVSGDPVEMDEKDRWIISPDDTLEVEFNKPMASRLQIGRAYVNDEVNADVAPFRLAPEVAYEYRWIDSRRIKVTPREYWPAETALTLTLADGIRPAPQAQYAKGPEIHLLTTPNIVGLENVSPTGRTARRATVELSFTKRIRPSATPVGARDTSKLASIEPAVKGEWVWLSDSKLAFRADELLTPATNYELRINPNLIADRQFIWEKPLGKGEKQYPLVTRNFHTQGLHVQSSSARFDFDPKDFLKQRFYLDMELSVPVKVDVLERHFTIWFTRTNDEGKSIDVPLVYKIEKTGDSDEGLVRRFSVVSDWIDRPAEDRRIQYRISKGLEPSIGNRPLQSDYENYFLQEKPSHISIRGLEWKEKDGRYHAALDLSAPVNPDRLAEFMTMVREGAEEKALPLNVAVDSGRQSDRSFRYSLSGTFLPGESYKLAIRRGLLAEDGAFTPELRETTSSVPNLDQRLEFAVDGNVISRRDSNAVPIRVTNAGKFRVQVERIFENNVNYFINNKLNDANLGTVAKEVYSKEFTPDTLFTGEKRTTRNKELTAAIDVADVIPPGEYGLYRISLIDQSNGRDKVDRRWFMSTDIGLAARRFGNRLVVWANSLKDLQPKGDTRVRAFDRWNQVVASARVDSSGFATLIVPGGQVVTHLIADSGDDMAVMDLGKHGESLSGFDTSGIATEKMNLRTFIYSERGVYRPGDMVHLVAVTREDKGRLPHVMPVKFSLSNPEGKQIVSENYRLSDDGVYVYDYEVPAAAKTGKWRANVVQGSETLGHYEFQVEEFVPNKIKVEMKLLESPVTPGGKLRFAVIGTNLYGPPAADSRVSASVSLRPSYFKPNGYERFSFGHDETEFQRVEEELVESKLDNEGRKVFEYQLPESIDSPIGLAAHYQGTVLDDGGRGVSEYAKVDVELFSQYVGARRLSDTATEVGDTLGFEVVNVSPSGKMIPQAQQSISVRVFHDKSVTHYRKNERGYFRYVTEKKRELVAELGDPRDEQGKFVYTPEHSGSHVLEVRDSVGGQVTRLSFNVRGRRDTVDRLAASDVVDLKLLDGEPRIGDEVRVEIRTPWPGKVLLTGEREKVLFHRVVEMTDTRQVVTVPVDSSHFPNFYLSAMAIAPASVAGANEPSYANGLLNVSVTDPAQALEVELLGSAQVKPNQSMTVGVQVKDREGRPASQVHFTLAAVDVGILNLTNYKTPDMKGYFNRKHRLGVEHYSLYPMLMPLVSDIKARISPSGDAPSRALVKKTRVNPDSQERIKSVALWSGVEQTDANGFAEVKLDVPDFDGTLRLMVVAYGDRQFASVDREVLVRDNLVVRPHLPRFLATGDEFTLPVTIANTTKLQDVITVRAEVSPHIEVLGPSTRTVSMSPGERKMVDFALRVRQATGVATFKIDAEGAGEATRKEVRVPVRAPGSAVSVGDSGQVDANTPKTVELPTARFLDGTAELGMRISDNRLVRFQNSLSYLLRYPHGCLEQTTSKAFPLLHFGSMATMADAQFSAEKSPRYFATEAVKKIQRMQRSDGAFTYWEGSSSINNWSTIYASHFLVEARKTGIDIDEATWNNMLHHLGELSRRDMESDDLYSGGEEATHAIYTLYVLAMAEENVLSRLNWHRDNLFDELRPHDKARLAAAYAVLGKKDVARDLLAKISDLGIYDTSYRYTSGSFRSNVRDMAMLLDAVVTVDPESPLISGLVDQLAGKMQDGRWGTTQENAFAFLAIGKAASQGAKMGGPEKVTVRLGDGTVVPFSGQLLLKTPELLKGNVRLETKGEGEIQFVWEAVGVEKEKKAVQKDRGLEVRRAYLDKDGKPVKLDEVRQGDLVVVELTMQSLNSGTVENVAIVDLLPAGLEIENSRLSTSAAIPWTQSSAVTDYVDIRDDRLNLYLSVGTSRKTYYYTTRAVTVGKFALPGVYAEAMYNPEIMSESGRGKLTILPAEKP